MELPLRFGILEHFCGTQRADVRLLAALQPLPFICLTDTAAFPIYLSFIYFDDRLSAIYLTSMRAARQDVPSRIDSALVHTVRLDQILLRRQ